MVPPVPPVTLLSSMTYWKKPRPPASEPSATTIIPAPPGEMNCHLTRVMVVSSVGGPPRRDCAGGGVDRAQLQVGKIGGAVPHLDQLAKTGLVPGTVAEDVSLAVREIESRARRDDDAAGAVEDHERAGDRSDARSAGNLEYFFVQGIAVDEVAKFSGDVVGQRFRNRVDCNARANRMNHGGSAGHVDHCNPKRRGSIHVDGVEIFGEVGTGAWAVEGPSRIVQAETRDSLRTECIDPVGDAVELTEVAGKSDAVANIGLRLERVLSLVGIAVGFQYVDSTVDEHYPRLEIEAS